MKYFWIRIKLFFTSQSFLDFVKRTIIILPIVLGTLILFLNRNKLFLNSKIKHMILQEVATSTNITLNQTEISDYNVFNHSIDITYPSSVSDTNFWEGDAIYYRYTISNHGIQDLQINSQDPYRSFVDTNQ
ncbi:MAG: hypothetical protein ACRCTQ_05495 [Brevinemataceae bacterium]